MGYTLWKFFVCVLTLLEKNVVPLCKFCGFIPILILLMYFFLSTLCEFLFCSHLLISRQCYPS